MGVSADELSVVCERDVALDHTGTHVGGRKIARNTMFRITKGCASMGDYEVGPVKWSICTRGKRFF